MRILTPLFCLVLAVIGGDPVIESQHPNPFDVHHIILRSMGANDKASEQTVTYSEAVAICQERNQTLLVPQSWSVNALLFEVLGIETSKRLWIGVQGGPDPSHRQWVTTTNSPLKTSETYWGPNEPNNYRGHNERCVEIRYLEKNKYNANWNDAPCDHRNLFLCQPVQNNI